MSDLDIILASIRHQREDLERRVAETAVRGEETSALLEKLEELRRRLPQEDDDAKSAPLFPASESPLVAAT